MRRHGVIRDVSCDVMALSGTCRATSWRYQGRVMRRHGVIRDVSCDVTALSGACNGATPLFAQRLAPFSRSRAWPVVVVLGPCNGHDV